MLNDIKIWIETFYENDYTFDDPGFQNIISRLSPIIQSFSQAEANYVNGILGKILSKYEIRDYFYVVEIFEYEFVPLFE